MSRRLRKWVAKTEPDVVGQRLKQTRGLGVEKQETFQPQLHELNMKVKAVLNEMGVPAHLHHYYTSAGQEFWKLQKKGAEGPVNTEADGIAAGWVSRGLNFEVLQKVAGLFGYNPRLMILEEDCPAGVPLCDDNPQDVGAAPDPGISSKASRCDHVHKGATLPHASTHRSDGSDPIADVSAFNVFKPAWCYDSIISGTWSIVIDGSHYLLAAEFTSGYWEGAIGDEIQFKFSSRKGSFTFILIGEVSPHMGIATIYIDGVSQGTIDFYSPGNAWNIFKTLSITVATDGEHTLNIKTTGKNDLSTGYSLYLVAWFFRT